MINILPVDKNTIKVITDVYDMVVVNIVAKFELEGETYMVIENSPGVDVPEGHYSIMGYEDMESEDYQTALWSLDDKDEFAKVCALWEEYRDKEVDDD